MNKKQSIKPLAAAIGTIVLASMASMPVAMADASPFGMTDLGSGYQVAKEGKCGGDMKKSGDMKDGKCGGDMKKKEGKCGGDKKKEGKCGEGKCGASKK